MRSLLFGWALLLFVFIGTLPGGATLELTPPSLARPVLAHPAAQAGAPTPQAGYAGAATCATCHADLAEGLVRHRLASRLSATFQYLYEPFDVYDFAFDPSVVDGLVQPSTLVMDYVYRPYRAQSAVAGLSYSW